MAKKNQIWSQRNLTLEGRNLVSKTFGISNLIYSLSLSEFETSHIKMSHSALNNFIWKQKPAKVKHSTMISEQHSFRIVYIESQAKALRMSWIYRISKTKGWGDIARKYFNEVGGIYFILRCFYDIQYLPKMQGSSKGGSTTRLKRAPSILMRFLSAERVLYGSFLNSHFTRKNTIEK